jgi:hypothetical protein
MQDSKKLPIKTYFFWIILMTLVGAALSIFLIPDAGTIAHIHTQAQRYKEAQNYYAKQYKKGVRTPELLYRLSQLELKRGNIDAAVTYGEELMRRYPQNLSALKYMENLYASNLDFQKYFETLKKEEALQPKGTPENVRTLQSLAVWYASANQPGQKAKILEEIIKTQRASPKNYTDWAYYFAQQKQYGDAARIMEEKMARFPQAIELEDILFIVWIKNKEAEKRGNPTAVAYQSIDLLSNYLYEKKRRELTQSALYFVTSNYPSWAPLFIRRVYPLIEGHPTMEYVALENLWYNSKQPADKKFAFAKISENYQRYPKNRSFQSLYFNALQESNYTVLLSEYLKSDSVMHLRKDDVKNFALWARSKKRYDLANEMLHRMPAQYWEKDRVSHVILLVAAGRPDAYARFQQLIGSSHPTDEEMIQLFWVAMDHSMTREALEIGLKLNFNALSADELAEVVFFFIQQGMADEIQRKIYATRPQMRNEMLGPALALLDAKAGYSLKVAEWLHHQKKVSESVLEKIYFLANEQKEYPLALYAAKKMKNAYPSPCAEAYYAVALVKVGKVENGMCLMEKTYCQHGCIKEVEDAYFEALTLAVKVNPAYVEPLRSFMHRKMKTYCLPPETLRDYAFIYLDNLNDFESAVNIYLCLFEQGCAIFEDFQRLIEIWGPCVTEAQCCFIYQMALRAPPKYLQFWLQSLNSIGKYGATIEIMRSVLAATDCLFDFEVYNIYLSALFHCRNYYEMRGMIDALLPHATKKFHLEVLANYAGAIDYFEGRRMAWEKAVGLYPEDILAWQLLANAAFDQNDDCGTLAALTKFFSLYNQSCQPNQYLYVSLYQYAVILKRHKRFVDSKYCYYQALCHIYRCSKKSFESVLYEALIYEGLSAPALAFRKMCELYQLTSHDPEAAANYAQTLMNFGAWSSARRLIGETIGL